MTKFMSASLFSILLFSGAARADITYGSIGDKGNLVFQVNETFLHPAGKGEQPKSVTVPACYAVKGGALFKINMKTGNDCLTQKNLESDKTKLHQIRRNPEFLSANKKESKIFSGTPLEGSPQRAVTLDPDMRTYDASRVYVKFDSGTGKISLGEVTTALSYDSSGKDLEGNRIDKNTVARVKQEFKAYPAMSMDEHSMARLSTEGAPSTITVEAAPTEVPVPANNGVTPSENGPTEVPAVNAETPTHVTDSCEMKPLPKNYSSADKEVFCNQKGTELCLENLLKDYCARGCDPIECLKKYKKLSDSLAGTDDELDKARKEKENYLNTAQAGQTKTPQELYDDAKDAWANAQDDWKKAIEQASSRLKTVEGARRILIGKQDGCMKANGKFRDVANIDKQLKSCDQAGSTTKKVNRTTQSVGE